MKSKIIKSFQYISFLLAGVALLYFAFRGVDLNDMILQIRKADYRWVALSLVFATIALILRTIRWRLLIEPLDEYPKRINIFHAINIGYLANFVFPRIGEIARCGILNRTDRSPVDRLFGTVITERIFDMLLFLFMLCLILILRFNAVSSFIVENIVHPVVEKIKNVNIVLIIATIATIALFLSVSFKLFKKQLSKTIAAQKIKNLLQGVFKGIKSVKQVRNFKLLIILSFAIFVMYLLQSYVLFFALESASLLGLGDALFVLVISAFAIILPIQGGIGAFHWIVSVGLIFLGLSREEGLAYATISHSATSVLFILLGVISLFFVFFTTKLCLKT